MLASPSRMRAGREGEIEKERQVWMMMVMMMTTMVVMMTTTTTTVDDDGGDDEIIDMMMVHIMVARERGKESGRVPAPVQRHV